MKKCYKCNVSIQTSANTCPLCHSNVGNDSDSYCVFPIIPTMYTKHRLFFQILLFVSIVGCVVCTIINYMVTKKIGWAWFVIAGIISFWLTFIVGIKRRHHFMKLLFSEVFLILITSVLWDYFTGWHLWSITYVLPFLSIAYITALFFLRIFIKNIFKDYIIYIYINCLIGLVPLYFIIRNILTVSWPSIICIIFSILSFLALAIFNYHQMKNELERRLHV